MKILPTTSLALLVASLWSHPGSSMANPLQDPPPTGGDGGMNQAMEVPPEPTAEEPAAEPATDEPAKDPAADPARQPAPPAPDAGPAAGRKPDPADELVGLQFRDQKVSTLIDTISLWTGKVVIPKSDALSAGKITIVSDRKMPRSEALNLMFQAFRINGLGVVETDDLILIDTLSTSSLPSLQPAKILGPDVEIEQLPENGNIVVKVFRIKNTKAQQVFDRLSEMMPDYATIQLDNNSNQLILEGDIALAKRVQRLIGILDVPAYVDVQTRTLKLSYQDAQTIASIITDLFSARPPTGGASSARAGGGGQPGQPRARPQGQPGAPQGGDLVGTSEQLVVTTLPATNSMTIRAEPSVMAEIESLIAVLDQPSSQGEGGIFRLYDLRFTDPLKVQAVLQSLLEGGGGTRRTAGGGTAGRAGAGTQRVAAPGGGAGGESGADVAIANIFRIEAYPDSNRLIVVSKTPDNFVWLDALIEQIDRPLDAGLPRNIPLKHASAVELAEILNALLAQSGSAATIRAPEEGLSGIDFNVASGNQNGTSNTNAFTSGNTNQPGAGGTGTGIQFPWASARGAGEDQAEVSALVGKSRVVPNASQNSLLVLAPPEIQDSLSKIVEDLDRPGRQVMISVILAEVQLGDDFQLGIKWGQNVAPQNGNNAVLITGAGDNSTLFKGKKEDIFPPDLSESILDFNVDANVVLQALAQETTVRILQQPRVFTGDNQEAKFFQGQDVPFQASSLSNLNTAGGVNATFEQIPVGIGLNVRPRITKDMNVNMEIEILLSNLNQTTSGVGDNPIIDRRQTNTTATVKNGQTIVLSGIRKEQENKIKNKLPLLGDVPVLDWVFANTNEVKTVTELLVFVTPTVVDNPDANDSNYNADERKRLRELAKPVAEMSKQLIRDREIVSDDAFVDSGPGEPLKPIDVSPDAARPAPVAPPVPAAPKSP